MIKHKSYIDIEVAKENNIAEFIPGDHIIIQEKIDGANAAIRYDTENDTVIAQSRKNILDVDNNLRGFYEWAQTFSDEQKKTIRVLLGDKLVLFGEWLVPHTVRYPDDKYGQFYAYDIYNTETECYMHQSEVRSIVESIGFNYVPILYIGDFQSWDHCRSFVGQTRLGGEYGEGIVVKNQTLIDLQKLQQAQVTDETSVASLTNGRSLDHKLRRPFYLKIVGEKFKETKPIKKKKVLSPEEAEAYEQAVKDTESIVTEARVRKMLHKLVDEGILVENWDNKDLAIVAKNLPKLIFEDCLKEENDRVKEIPNFSKLCGKTAMILVRSILDEKTKSI